jgi:hypothetical protein
MRLPLCAVESLRHSWRVQSTFGEKSEGRSVGRSARWGTAAGATEWLSSHPRCETESLGDTELSDGDFVSAVDLYIYELVGNKMRGIEITGGENFAPSVVEYSPSLPPSVESLLIAP